MKVCIVQARMGSKRLPGKVLLPLNGHTVVGETLTRCKQIRGIDRVICAIPDTQENDKLELETEKYCKVVRGPEHDVLTRYFRAAPEDATHVMRITSDCPLISPELCGAVLQKLIDFDADYASNVDPRTFPQGMDCEVFTIATLHHAHYHAGPHEREHVTTWMRSANIGRVNVSSPWRLEGRLTLDTWDDYQTIRASFESGMPSFAGRPDAFIRASEATRRNNEHQPQRAS
jgi:spore coat polysaccharide biosynthesis protein SpsF